MANIIHVSPEKLAGTAKRFEQTAGEVRMICRNMTGTVQALSGRIWSGSAAAAYKNKFNSLQGDIDRLYRMIAAHASHLEQIAREYKAGDDQSAADAGILSGSVIG